MVSTRSFVLVFFGAVAHLAAQTPSCKVTPPATFFMRVESYTELVPDVLVQCTGGAPNAQTIAALSLSLAPAAPITSRLVGPTTSEAMLLVNEPSAANRQNGVNAFLGQLTGGVNQMNWSNIPVVFSAAGTLTFRLTNIRTALPGGNVGSGAYGNEATLQGILTGTLGGVSVVPNYAFNLGLIGQSVTLDLRQCDDSGPAGTVVSGPSGLNPTLLSGGTGQIQYNLRYRELIARSFSSQQDETGTTLAGLPGVGTATQGMQLAAVFYNIPVGLQIYVTGGPVSTPGSISAEAILSSAGAPGAPVSTAHGACPLTAGAPMPLYPVTVNSIGVGLVRWTVTADDPTEFEQLSFGVALAGTIPANDPFPLTVQMTIGPASFFGDFSSSSGPFPSSSAPIPRFAGAVQSVTVPIAHSLSFVGVAGAGTVPSQLVSAPCISPAISTKSGGNWLSASVVPGGLNVSVSTSGLSPDAYFGQISCSNNAAFSVVLSVLSGNSDPGPSINPIGLVFVLPENGTTAPQFVTIYDLALQPVTYVQAEGNLTGTATPSTPATIEFQANAAGVSPGIYTSTFHYTFSDGYTAQVVSKVIVTPASGAGAAIGFRNRASSIAACVSSSLTATFQSVGQDLYFTATYPVEIDVLVADNCGTPVSAGSVTVVISGETKPVPLAPSTITAGLWSGPWAPTSAEQNAQLTVTATAPNLPTATQTIQRNILSGGTAPVIVSGGIVNAATLQAKLALGGDITILGSNLSDVPYQPNTSSLPSTLGHTTVSVNGRSLPLLYVSPGQINALVPFDLAPGNYPLNVLYGSSVSNTAVLNVSGLAPGVFTLNSSGTGPGAIESATTGLVPDAANPVGVGDIVAVYATGLGSVVPPLANSGDLGPISPLAWVIQTNAVTATVGGVPAAIEYAGLAPLNAGLYQIDVQIPAGVATGSAVPVAITVGGVAAPLVTIAVK